MRLTIRDPRRLVGRLLLWQGMLELRARTSIGGSQGHGQRFAVARWAAQFFNYYDGVLKRWWWDVAADAEAWRKTYSDGVLLGWLVWQPRVMMMHADLS